MTLKTTACGNKNDRLDVVFGLGHDVKFTTLYEVKSMMANAVFALFLLLCFSLRVREGHNRWLTYWKQVIVIVFDRFVTNECMTEHTGTVAHKHLLD